MERPFCRVQDCEFEGADRTSHDWLRGHMKGVLAASSPEELKQANKELLETLQSVGAFKACDLRFERGDDPQGAQHALVAKLRVKEKGWLGLKTQATYSDATQSVGAEYAGKMNNVLGCAETLEIKGASSGEALYAGQPSPNSLEATFTKPRFWDRKCNLTLGLHFASIDRSRVSSHMLRDRGFSAGVSSLDGQHRVGYGLAWRDVSPRGTLSVDKETEDRTRATPSRSVLDECVPSVKSALSYTYTRNELDKPANPSQGRYLKLTAELAGLGGDVAFTKAQVDAKVYRPLTPAVSAGLSVRAGHIIPLFGSTAPLPDRYLLGGGTTLRGFAQQSVGPSDQGDYLGGTSFGAISALLSWQPPAAPLRDNNIRAVAFVNAGGVGCATGGGVAQTLADAARATRVSAGVGLVVPIGPLRLEVNLAQPLRSKAGDETESFQFGLGVEYV